VRAGCEAIDPPSGRGEDICGRVYSVRTWLWYSAVARSCELAGAPSTRDDNSASLHPPTPTRTPRCQHRQLAATPQRDESYRAGDSGSGERAWCGATERVSHLSTSIVMRCSRHPPPPRVEALEVDGETQTLLLEHCSTEMMAMTAGPSAAPTITATKRTGGATLMWRSQLGGRTRSVGVELRVGSGARSAAVRVSCTQQHGPPTRREVLARTAALGLSSATGGGNGARAGEAVADYVLFERCRHRSPSPLPDMSCSPGKSLDISPRTRESSGDAPRALTPDPSLNVLVPRAHGC
jgi:hypothetical protein